MDVVKIEKPEENENKVNASALPVEQPEKKEAKDGIGKYVEAATDQIKKKMMENTKELDFKEGSKSIAHMMTTAAALDGSDSENAEFLKRIKEEKQKELEQSFISDRFKEEAAKYVAKQKKAEAFYTNFRPILEFDFSPLIPKKSKTKLWGNRIKYDKKGNVISKPADEPADEVDVKESKPTYSDRSYGMPLMILMLILLTIPYCLITVVLAIGNGINAIFNGIARFGKPALIICGSIVGIAICLVALYCLFMGVDALFGTNILSSLR